MKFFAKYLFFLSLFAFIYSIVTVPPVLTSGVNFHSSKTSKGSRRPPIKKSDLQNSSTTSNSQCSDSISSNEPATKEPSKRLSNKMLYSTFRYIKGLLLGTLSASLMASISFKMITTLMKNNLTTTSSALNDACVLKDSSQAGELILKEKFSFDNLHESTKDTFNREHIFNIAQTALQKPILISGPPGCGKTILSYYCAKKAEALHIMVNLTSISNQFIGQFTNYLRDLIKDLTNIIDTHKKVVIVFDEIDTFGSTRVNLESDSSSSASERNAKTTALFLAIERLHEHMIYKAGKTDDTFYRLFMFTNFAGNLDTALLSRSKLIAIENPNSEEISNYLSNLTNFFGDKLEIYSRSLLGVSFRSLNFFVDDRDVDEQINSAVSQINLQFKLEKNEFEYKSLNHLSVDSNSILPQWQKFLNSCDSGNMKAVVGSAADCDKLMFVEGLAKEKKCNLLICYADTFAISQFNALQNFLTSVRSNADRSKPLMIYVTSKKIQNIQGLKKLSQDHNIFVFAKDFDLESQIRIDMPTWYDRKTILPTNIQEDAIEATHGCSFFELECMRASTDLLDKQISALRLKKYLSSGPNFVEIALQQPMPNLLQFNKKSWQILYYNPELIHGESDSHYNFFKATDAFYTKINQVMNEKVKLIQLFNDEITEILHQNENTCIVFSCQKLGSFNLSEIKTLVKLLNLTSLFLDDSDVSKFAAQVKNC